MTVDVEARLRADLPRVVELLADREDPPVVPATRRSRTARMVVGASVVAALLVASSVVIVDGGDGSGSRGIDTAGSSGAREATTEGWVRLPRSGLGGRTNTAVVWTGSEVLVWGGNVGSMYYQDGVAYDPGTGAWRRIDANRWAGPGALHAWTGERLYVVAKRSGAVYDLARDAWADVGYLPDDVMSGFVGLTWSGTDLYGTVGGSEGLRIARYDESRDGWDLGAALPAADDALSVWENSTSWSGDEVVVWNGVRAGWAYRPADDTWRTLPELDGALAGLASDLVVVGDQPLVVYAYDGASGRTLGVARLDGDTWHTVLETPTADLRRPTAVTDGAGVYVVDATGGAGPRRIDLSTSTVTELAGSPLSPAAGTTGRWAGTGLFVWGGLPTGSSTGRPDAAWYTPVPTSDRTEDDLAR